jgi:hypothetical protein
MTFSLIHFGRHQHFQVPTSFSVFPHQSHYQFTCPHLLAIYQAIQVLPFFLFPIFLPESFAIWLSLFQVHHLNH